MKKDSQGHTGEKAIEKLNMETVMMLFTPEIQQKCWMALLDIIENGKDRDRISAIKELFDRGLGKPRQAISLQDSDGNDAINSIEVKIIKNNEVTNRSD